MAQLKAQDEESNLNRCIFGYLFHNWLTLEHERLNKKSDNNEKGQNGPVLMNKLYTKHESPIWKKSM
jgi:hypothetical protein